MEFLLSHKISAVHIEAESHSRPIKTKEFAAEVGRSHSTRGGSSVNSIRGTEKMESCLKDSLFGAHLEEKKERGLTRAMEKGTVKKRGWQGLW